MLMQRPTQELINKWKTIYNENKEKLVPNKRTGLEIEEYLKNKYSITELQNEKLKDVVYQNVVLNEYSKSKLNGKNPDIKVFLINDNELYLKQDKVFEGIDIIVGVELNTSYFSVEGCSYLYDELVAFTGLDEKDIKNYFLVAQYIECREKFNE